MSDDDGKVVYLKDVKWLVNLAADDPSQGTRYYEIHDIGAGCTVRFDSDDVVPSGLHLKNESRTPLLCSLRFDCRTGELFVVVENVRKTKGKGG